MVVGYHHPRKHPHIRNLSTLVFFIVFFVNIEVLIVLSISDMLSDSKAKVAQVADHVLFRSFGSLVTPFNDGLLYTG